MKRFLQLFLVMVFLSQNLHAQLITPNDVPIFGFDKKISGSDFSYHYPIPGITNSILVRGNKTMNTMEFITKPVPLQYNASSTLFIFPFAIGANAISINIDMYVDDVKWFTFDTKSNPLWSKKNDNGAVLSFENIEYDGNQDMKGFLYLRLPNSLTKPGSPLKIKFVAQDAGLQTWIILYKDELKTEIKARLLPAIIESNGREKQTVFIDLFHFAPPQNAIINIDGKDVGNQNLKLGYNQFSILIDKVKKQKEITILLKTKGKILINKTLLKPSREWNVNFVQHAHTDIGYTRSQTEILAEHIRYIDYALDFCDLTDTFPDEAKFRWTCEASWAVEEFINTRPPQQVERLLNRIKEGRIEVTAMMFNFDEIPDENILAHSLDPLKTLKKYNIPVKVAMQNDVNGIGWCFADYFPKMGVKYLTMGINAHRAYTCFDYPTVFRWQSPSGSEMIAYRAEHYNKGNFVGVEKSDFTSFEVKLLEYLASLEEIGYPYSIAQIQFSGYLIDNSPPSIQACENIRKWNEKYKFPKLKLSASSDFLDQISSQYYNQLPVIKGGWPDWWTDGFGASPREVTAMRYAQSDFIANTSTLTLAGLLGSYIPKNSFQRIEDILSATLFYGEHTTGYWASVSAPYCKQTLEQRAIKESYAWEAYRRAKILGETAQGSIQSLFQKSNQYPSLIVTNTLSWTRSGLIKVYIEHEMVGVHQQMDITDFQGKHLKYQMAENRPEGTYWWIWVDSITPMSSKQYFIVTKDSLNDSNGFQKIDADQNDLIYAENQWYTLKINTKEGTITQWYDKQNHQNLLDSGAMYHFGEFIGESLAERSSLESRKMGDHVRYSLESVQFLGLLKGDIFDSYMFSAMAKNGIETINPNFKFEFKLYHDTKMLELSYTIVKNENINPESFYIAMPFNVQNGKIYCELPGGVMEAGVDQIKGSSSDWNTSQAFVSVASDKQQIIVSCNEMPLWQFGNINIGRYKPDAKPETTHLYSWPMNNYWVTNFNADFRGEMSWNYLITNTDTKIHAQSTRFGWNNKVPLTYRVLPKGSKESQKSAKTMYDNILNFNTDNILVVSMQPLENEHAIIVHIREINGTITPLHITSNFISYLSIQEVNSIFQQISDAPIQLNPYESKFLKILLP